MKAMILAAGRGERMMPLTLDTPKPLLMLNGLCLIEHVIVNLHAAGIRDIVINVSYFAEKIIARLGNGQRYGVNIAYSEEKNGLLGTGGGIYQALPILGEQPFLLASSDVLTDFPYASLSNKTDGDAHLVMVDNPSFHPKGDFAIDSNNLLSLTGDKKTYANIAVLHPRLFVECHAGNFPLGPLFIKAIQHQRATGELYRGEWNNIGTPAMLQELAIKL